MPHSKRKTEQRRFRSTIPPGHAPRREALAGRGTPPPPIQFGLFIDPQETEKSQITYQK